ncbi:ER lumen protein-retaining receptor isoform X1 [Manihot esculenta]|uniref:ER lumen protein-retaining receptor isoform X1 n=1 Tax=Manihot esculenta TaxID=3983 RepID=UPI000B5D4235|nr:ER lumen protein-retaining receptor isoform X1 [Manihot esculenta]
MNLFRFAGDMTHLVSVLVLLLKIHTIKSCAGISLKTQELYALVFVTRYLDIFTSFISFYNTVMKLIFLGSSFSIVWYIRRHRLVRKSYDKDQDTFRHYFLVLPCLILALLIHEKFTFTEIMWTFSLYLEAVAILPQLVLLQRTRNIDNLTGQYVFLLGAYRALYILNWTYRYFTEEHYVHWISVSCFSLASLTPSPGVFLNFIIYLLLQLGYQELSRHYYMLISSIITSEAGRTM